MAEPRAARYTDIVPAKKTVIGSKVVNAQNEDLGQIEELGSYSTLEPAGSLTRSYLLEGFLGWVRSILPFPGTRSTSI